MPSAPGPSRSRGRPPTHGGPAPPPASPGTARRTARAGLALTAGALAALATVTVAVLRSAGHDRWDPTVQGDLLTVHGRWTADLARVSVDLAAPAVLVGATLLAAVLLWRAARRPSVAAGVLAVPVVTAALAQLLAVAFVRVRPAGGRRLGLPVLDGSFPSAATADAAALWGVLGLAGVLLVHRGTGRALCAVVGLVVTGAVAWGQVYRVRAEPTDVLAGALLAAAAVGVAAALLASWPDPLPGPAPDPGG